MNVPMYLLCILFWNTSKNILIRLFGEHMIKHVEDRKGHDRRYGIDPEKIKNELGWYPETPFEKGIVKTIEWYLSHKEWMENVTSGDYQKYYDKMYANR